MPQHNHSLLASVPLSLIRSASRAVCRRRFQTRQNRCCSVFLLHPVFCFHFLTCFSLLLPRASPCFLLNLLCSSCFSLLSSSWMLNGGTQLRWRSHWAEEGEEEKKRGVMSEGNGSMCVNVCVCVCVCVCVYLRTAMCIHEIVCFSHIIVYYRQQLHTYPNINHTSSIIYIFTDLISALHRHRAE